MKTPRPLGLLAQGCFSLKTVSPRYAFIRPGHLVLGRWSSKAGNFFLLLFQVLGWCNTNSDKTQINTKNKFHYICQGVHKTVGVKECPDLRNGMGSGASTCRKGIHRSTRKADVRAIRALPCPADGLSDKYFSLVIALFLVQAPYPNSFR